MYVETKVYNNILNAGQYKVLQGKTVFLLCKIQSKPVMPPQIIPVKIVKNSQSLID